MITQQEKLKHIADVIHTGLLKPLGFKRRRNTFNRKTEDGLIQVINFQASFYNSESTGGIFWVNIGVCIPEIEEVTVKLYGGSSNFIPEYKCQIRARVGHLNKDRRNVEFSLDENLEATSAEILRYLRDFEIPFFHQLDTHDKVLKRLESYKPSDPFICLTPLIDAGIVYWHQGNKIKAQELFTKHYNDYVSDPKNPGPGHGEFMKELAQEFGLEI